MIKMLPIIDYKGKKYFRDDRLRQTRNVDNPHEYVDFTELDTSQIGGE
jgi:hypothetical protein